MSVDNEVLYDSLSPIWLDQPVHKLGCHCFVGPKCPNERMSRVQKGVVFVITSLCLRTRTSVQGLASTGEEKSMLNSRILPSYWSHRLRWSTRYLDPRAYIHRAYWPFAEPEMETRESDGTKSTAGGPRAAVLWSPRF